MRKLFALLLVCLFVAMPAWAASATPLDYTRTVLEQARTIVAGGQTHDEKLAALSSLFSRFLDSDAMGREALGQHWSTFTPPQQKDFLVLFHELLERTYVQKLLLFENPNFVYAAQQLTADGASVDTKIVTPRDQFDVVYRLRPSGNIWLVTSIKVDDVSLTANLGSQLDDLLSRMSADDLLALMRRKYGDQRGEA